MKFIKNKLAFMLAIAIMTPSLSAMEKQPLIQNDELKTRSERSPSANEIQRQQEYLKTSQPFQEGEIGDLVAVPLNEATESHGLLSGQPKQEAKAQNFKKSAEKVDQNNKTQVQTPKAKSTVVSQPVSSRLPKFVQKGLDTLKDKFSSKSQNPEEQPLLKLDSFVGQVPSSSKQDIAEAIKALKDYENAEDANVQRTNYGQNGSHEMTPGEKAQAQEFFAGLTHVLKTNELPKIEKNTAQATPAVAPAPAAPVEITLKNSYANEQNKLEQAFPQFKDSNTKEVQQPAKQPKIDFEAKRKELEAKRQKLNARKEALAQQIKADKQADLLLDIQNTHYNQVEKAIADNKAKFDQERKQLNKDADKVSKQLANNGHKKPAVEQSPMAEFEAHLLKQHREKEEAKKAAAAEKANKDVPAAVKITAEPVKPELKQNKEAQPEVVKVPQHLEQKPTQQPEQQGGFLAKQAKNAGKKINNIKTDVVNTLTGKKAEIEAEKKKRQAEQDAFFKEQGLDAQGKPLQQTTPPVQQVAIKGAQPQQVRFEDVQNNPIQPQVIPAPVQPQQPDVTQNTIDQQQPDNNQNGNAGDNNGNGNNQQPPIGNNNNQGNAADNNNNQQAPVLHADVQAILNNQKINIGQFEDELNKYFVNQCGFDQATAHRITNALKNEGLKSQTIQDLKNPNPNNNIAADNFKNFAAKMNQLEKAMKPNTFSAGKAFLFGGLVAVGAGLTAALIYKAVEYLRGTNVKKTEAALTELEQIISDGNSHELLAEQYPTIEKQLILLDPSAKAALAMMLNYQEVNPTRGDVLAIGRNSALEAIKAHKAKLAEVKKKSIVERIAFGIKHDLKRLQNFLGFGKKQPQAAA